MTNIQPITLKCVKAFNNTSKWRGTVTTKQLLNSPLGKYLNIPRNDAIAELGINLHGDQISTFGIKIHPQKGSKYETKMYGHLQDDFGKKNKKHHMILKGSETVNKISNNTINGHLSGKDFHQYETLFDEGLFMKLWWNKCYEINDRLKNIILKNFDQNISNLQKDIKYRKNMAKEKKKIITSEDISKLNMTINNYENASKKVKSIDKTLEEDTQAGKTIYNMSFRQLERSKALETVNNLEKEYKAAIAKKQKLQKLIENNEKRVDKDCAKLEKQIKQLDQEKRKFCKTHGINEEELCGYYEV